MHIYIDNNEIKIAILEYAAKLLPACDVPGVEVDLHTVEGGYEAKLLIPTEYISPAAPTEAPVVAPEPKPKRKRRTKQEIEADRLAEEAAGNNSMRTDEEARIAAKQAAEDAQEANQATLPFGETTSDVDESITEPNIPAPTSNLFG